MTTVLLSGASGYIASHTWLALLEAGFDVTYEVDGVQKVVRMDREPGRRIPVEDGELVLSQS